MTSVVTLTSLMKAGNTAVVTGASSGIGRAACMEFASAGMNVWMVDVDETELQASQQMVAEAAAAAAAANNSSAKVQSKLLDVSDCQAMMDFATNDVDKCHILMNNAGIGLGGGPMTDIQTVHHVVNVNTYGPIHGCLAFVPKMKESGEPGIIINTGSKQGITMPPGNLTYNLSKAALKTYTEGLEHELMLERVAGTGQLRAALLIPGWVNTSIMLKSERAKAKNAGKDYKDDECFFHENKPASGAWMPNQVIEFMKQELDAGKFYVVCPDNDVDRETDNLRMQWTMGDIINDRPPLSRWHPEYKDQFTAFLEESKKK